MPRGPLCAQAGGVAAAACVRRYEHSAEEVNHVAVTPRGDLLAAADDSGQVAVVSLASHALVKTLKRQHTNIVSAVAWRPNRAGELLSAGLDSRVVAWDAPNGRVRRARSAHVCFYCQRRALTRRSGRRSWDTAEVLAEVEARESGGAASSAGGEQLQMCNPPLAHSVRIGCSVFDALGVFFAIST